MIILRFNLMTMEFSAGMPTLTFTDGNRLNVNKLGISGNVYDSNNWVGEGGMILANEGATGVNWKNIEISSLRRWRFGRCKLCSSLVLMKIL